MKIYFKEDPEFEEAISFIKDLKWIKEDLEAKRFNFGFISSVNKFMTENNFLTDNQFYALKNIHEKWAVMEEEECEIEEDDYWHRDYHWQN